MVKNRTFRTLSGHEKVTLYNKTDHNNITEISLKVALNTINQPINLKLCIECNNVLVYIFYYLPLPKYNLLRRGDNQFF